VFCLFWWMSEEEFEEDCADACDERDVWIRSMSKPTTWTYPFCGGEYIHGTKKCKGYGTGKMINGDYEYVDKCYCIKRPDMNYQAHYLLITESMMSRLHLSTNGKEWDDFANKFWKFDSMSEFKGKCEGRNLLKRLQGLLKKATLKRNDGYETHPPETPYETLLQAALDEYIPWCEENERISKEKKIKSAKRKEREEEMNTAKKALCPTANDSIDQPETPNASISDLTSPMTPTLKKGRNLYEDFDDLTSLCSTYKEKNENEGSATSLPDPSHTPYFAE
jgi:hypothetical protein